MKSQPIDSSFCLGFGARLRQERSLRKLTQANCDQIGGVSVVSQRFYEAGDRMPNAEYLFRLHRYGIDTCYLITSEKKSAEVDDSLIKEGLSDEIFSVIATWEKDREEPAQSDLKAKIFNLLYAQFYEKGSLDKGFVKRYLKLV